ncbi:hypothetical protein AB833_00475 [Chromatiales bacterium (ex Bugula neritina AB1)]|nr:hypothetical protein AB833_00475 [Chromatiales bacterium (ex Bugula neritina AB1)]
MSKGWSPLMLAARGKHPLIVEYLLSHGVDSSLKNHRRLTAMDIALKNKEQAIIEMLSASASVD